MNDIRAAAINCEAKKHSYRQTQDGVVVSFVLHPQEVPDGLATAPLGTRYVLALVEIGDNEQPIKREPAKPKSYAQKAGILCNEPAFWRFLQETYRDDHPAHIDADFAAETVRQICGVDSRKALVDGTPAGHRWRDLEAEYDAWRRM